MNIQLSSSNLEIILERINILAAIWRWSRAESFH